MTTHHSSKLLATSNRGLINPPINQHEIKIQQLIYNSAHRTSIRKSLLWAYQPINFLFRACQIALLSASYWSPKRIYLSIYSLSASKHIISLLSTSIFSFECINLSIIKRFKCDKLWPYALYYKLYALACMR